MYFILSYVQLKDAIAFTYAEFLKTGVATRADWAAAKVEQGHVSLLEDVASKDEGDLPEM